MKQFLNAKKKNWLLWSSIILLLTYTVLVSFVIDTDYLSSNSSRNNINFDNPLLLLFMVSVFAPVAEEFIFRGYLTGNKYISWISVTLLGIYVFSKYSEINAAAYVIFLITFLIIKFKKDISPKKSILLKNVLIISNSICFAVLHYKSSDFESLTLASPMICQFALGLFLSWIIINFSILRAIIIHSLVNFTLISVAYALYISDVDKKTYVVENDKVKIEWRESASLFGTPEFRNSRDSIVARNIRLENFYKMMRLITGKQYRHQFKDNNPYDIKIHKIDNTDTLNIAVEGNHLMPQTGLLKNDSLNSGPEDIH